MLSDWSLFDLGLFAWIKVSVQDSITGEAMNCHRKMHTLTAHSLPEIILQNSRFLWCNSFAELRTPNPETNFDRRRTSIKRKTITLIENELF